MPTLTADQLRQAGTLLFTALGAPEEIAATVAGSLALSNLMGHDSHGLMRVNEYATAIRRGRLNPAARPSLLSETPTTALVDGAWGFGQLAARLAIETLIRLAQASTVAAVGIRHCNHIGRVGEYSELAAQAGVISMITLCAGGRATSTAPYGGMRPTLSTNPIAFGVPAGERPPLIADFATTVVANGKVQQARDRGERIPVGWVQTAEGLPTTDPNDLFRGGMLLPMAGHKGYGLSLVAEALGGALTGAAGFVEGEQTGNCTFMWGIRIDAFQPADEFRAREDRSLEKAATTPPAPGFERVLIPGEPERLSRARREGEGVPVPAGTWERLLGLAQELGVADQLPGVAE